MFGYEWCTEQPCLCRNDHSALMLHVDDVLFVGKRKFWEEQFLPKLREKFTVSASVLEGEGSSISFLKRKLVKVERGLALVPGTNIDKLVENFVTHFGQVRIQHVTCDASIQLPDVSSNLTSRDAYAYRSAVGGLLYLARDRPADLLFCAKELSAKMAQPTVTAWQRLKKVMGYVKGTSSYAVVIAEPEGGQGKWKNTNESFWVLESASDSDWSSNKEHRRSTSAGIHLINGFYMFGSSRTQRTVSLSSCKAELHGMVSTLADGIYIRRCLSFLTRADIFHYLLTDSSSARQLASKQGVGKIRHLDGKILWVQQHVLAGDVFLQQLPTARNVADLCTKAPPQQRVKVLLHELGVCKDNGLTIIGQHEHDEQVEKHGSRRQVMQVAKSLMRVATVMGLVSGGANGQILSGELEETTCAIGPQDQCDAAVTTAMTETKIFNFVCVFWFWPHGSFLDVRATGFIESGNME